MYILSVARAVVTSKKEQAIKNLLLNSMPLRRLLRNKEKLLVRIAHGLDSRRKFLTRTIP